MKTLGELKKLDTIIVDKTSKECLDFFKNKIGDSINEFTLPVYFPLEEGVIRHNEIVDGERYYSYVYFYDSEESCRLEFYCYNREDYKFNYLMTLNLKEVNKSNMVYDIIDVDAGNKENAESRSKSLTQVFGVILMYIIYIKDNPKVKTCVTKKIPNGTSSNNSTYKRNRDILLGEKVVYSTSLSDKSDKNFKKRQRHTESWSVMSFPRHYKSGKTVIVKSHVRGNGNKEKKNYIVK